MDSQLHAIIQEVVQALSCMEEVQRVYLFRMKTDSNGLASFKLCVVFQTSEKQKAETQIYRDIDCDIPFDVILYTPQEWAAQENMAYSFANRVKKEGYLLYEKA